MRKLHDRTFSRMITVLFSVQLMVGSLCLLTLDAHAMSQPEGVQHVQVQNVQVYGTRAGQTSDQHGRSHSGNCYHCDQLDQLSNVVFLSVSPFALLLSGIDSLSVVRFSDSDARQATIRRSPTGPPRSSSLLYIITQRIRV